MRGVDFKFLFTGNTWPVKDRNQPTLPKPLPMKGGDIKVLRLRTWPALRAMQCWPSAEELESCGFKRVADISDAQFAPKCRKTRRGFFPKT